MKAKLAWLLGLVWCVSTGASAPEEMTAGENRRRHLHV